jgi:hypothetical protein
MPSLSSTFLTCDITVESLYYNGDIKLCTSTEHSKSMSAIFYAPSAYEVFVFALTALRAIKDSKIISGSSSAPFLVMLYRGSCLPHSA